MKYIILLILFIISLIYYQITSYQESISLKEIYIINKQELLLKIKENKIHISKNNNISILTQTYADKINLDLKSSVNLSVDFFPQSPFGKWGPIFNDTCEEASVLIAINYIRNNHINRSEFRDELLNIVDYENKTFGDYKHTNVNQTSKILRDYFNFNNYEIKDNPSIQEIKQILNKGNIIIAPFYGIGLNPYYSGKGPEYHFMVIKGYTEKNFITHDVGTKHGEDYSYNQEELFKRLHDYDSISIKKGKKRIIILKKSY